MLLFKSIVNANYSFKSMYNSNTNLIKKNQITCFKNISYKTSYFVKLDIIRIRVT